MRVIDKLIRALSIVVPPTLYYPAANINAALQTKCFFHPEL